MTLERSLHCKKQFPKFAAVMEEYMRLGHVELVPYRAVELARLDRDLHRFVWRSDPDQPLIDFKITRITSRVAANMALRHNALDHAIGCRNASPEQTWLKGRLNFNIKVQMLFTKGDFLLRKWNSSDPSSVVLRTVLFDFTLFSLQEVSETVFIHCMKPPSNLP